MSTETRSGTAFTAGDRRVAVLTAGFGITVAMWAAGYVGRLPELTLPSPVLLGVLLVCPIVGGSMLRRRTGLGPGHAAAAGAVCGVLNLLVLGSFLFDAARVGAPPAWIWMPGSIALIALLTTIGAALDGTSPSRPPASTGGFAVVAAGAAFLMLGLGGLVTSTDSGLAVVDRPNSFGYNMFLYPFSRMTGGIYYEHAHRLFGALVGLTTVVLALLLQLRDERRWVRRAGWAAAALVVVQGVLGGLRVTGRFTLSDSPDAMAPSLTLAMVHGVLGQLLFAGLVLLAVVTSARWLGRQPAEPVASRADRVAGAGLLVVLFVQLVLGALQRHAGILLMTHLAVGIALVTPLAAHVGFRAWGANERHPTVRRVGLALALAIVLQLCLGLAALAARGVTPAGGPAGGIEVLLATAHQWFAAVVLGLAVAVAGWSGRARHGVDRVAPRAEARSAAFS